MKGYAQFLILGGVFLLGIVIGIGLMSGMLTFKDAEIRSLQDNLSRANDEIAAKNLHISDLERDNTNLLSNINNLTESLNQCSEDLSKIKDEFSICKSELEEKNNYDDDIGTISNYMGFRLDAISFPLLLISTVLLTLIALLESSEEMIRKNTFYRKALALVIILLTISNLLGWA